MAQIFNITNFTSALEFGGARNNLFAVRIPSLPAAARGFNQVADWEYLCKGVDIPSSTIGVAPLTYFGREISFAADREFAELNTTVINDEGYYLHNAIESWIQSMNAMVQNLSLFNQGLRASYTTTVKLLSYRKIGSVDQEWDFVDCWPSAVSAIDLSWDSVNTIQEFTVTWQYSHYLHKNANIN